MWLNKISTKCLVLVVTIALKELRVVETINNTTYQGADGQSLHSATSSNHFAGDEITADISTDTVNHDVGEKQTNATGTPFGKVNPSFDDVKALHTKLMREYMKYIRPVKNQTKQVDVYLSFSVFSLQDLDELLETISVGSVFFLFWRDINMRWNESKHGGVKNIFVAYKDVWIPEIILSNPSDKLHSFGQDWQLIRFDSKGWASWAPGDIITAKCNLNHRYFPFDTQTCSLDLHVWAYLATEVKLIPIDNNIDTQLLTEDSSWTIVNTSAVAWGDDWVSSVTYTISLSRKPQNVIVNSILPILFLCLLNVLVFLLPPESGERVSFAITVLLSIAVFMTIVSNTLPKSSDPMPLIAFFLIADLAMSALVSVCTVWNLHIFYRHDSIPIPQWLVKIYNYSSHICRWDRPGRGQQYDKSEVTAINGTNNNKRTSLMDTERNDIEHFEFTRSVNAATAIGWQDISRMFDIFFLVFFTTFIILSFVTFFIITNMQ